MSYNLATIMAYKLPPKCFKII